jgi:flagellar basal body-associated protein FliL
MEESHVMEKAKEWVRLIIVIIVASLSLGAYVHNTFRTNREADNVEKRIHKSLGEIKTDVREIRDYLIK